MVQNYIGIDMGKDSFVVVRRSQDGKLVLMSYLNDALGIARFIRTLDKATDHCVLEITGNYHVRLLFELCYLGFKVSAINPKQSAHYAKMRLSITKTDAQDAQRLMEFGEQFTPSVYIMPDEFLQMVKQKRSVLRQLKRQKNVLFNQKHALEQLPKIDATALKVLQTMLDTIDEQIKILNEQINQTTDEEFGKLKDLIMTIKGIGNTISTALIVATNGFKDFDSPKKFAKFIGICPTHYQSGTSVRGKSHIGRSGDSELRALMYTATWSALKSNKACKEMYDRMRKAGKPAKVALCAVANKIIRQVFAVVRKNEAFNNDFVPKFQTTC
jgi:transposase